MAKDKVYVDIWGEKEEIVHLEKGQGIKETISEIRIKQKDTSIFIKIEDGSFVIWQATNKPDGSLIEEDLATVRIK